MNYQEAELQKLQGALYATLSEVDRICKKHGIRYFVTGLKDLISFYDIAKIGEKALSGLNFVASPSLDDIFATNREVAAIADGYIH